MGKVQGASGVWSKGLGLSLTWSLIADRRDWTPLHGQWTGRTHVDATWVSEGRRGHSHAERGLYTRRGYLVGHLSSLCFVMMLVPYARLCRTRKVMLCLIIQLMSITL